MFVGIEAELAQQLVGITHFQGRRAGVHFHREEAIHLADPTAGVVDHVVALERPPLRIEQTSEHGQGFHHPHLAVLHAPLVQVVAGTRRFDAGRRHVIAFEVEAHRTVFVGCERNEISPRPQRCAATTEVVCAQGDIVDVGLDVDNHPGAAPLMLAGQRHALRADHQRAVEVHATGEVVVERRALNETVAIDGVGAKVRQARQTDAISVGQRRHRDALQHVVLQVLAVTERGVVVATALTGGAAADAAGNLLARTAERHVDAQVDPAIARIAAAVAARTVEQRQAPIGIAAKQLGPLGPAEVDADALDIALTVGHPRVERTLATDAVVQRQRRVAGLAGEHVALSYAGAVGQGVISVGGVEPATVVADHQTARAVVVQALQIGAGAVVFGLVKIGVDAGAVAQGPVDGAAVLEFFAHLACRQSENHPRVQQIVDRGARRGIATALLIPIAEQFAFLPGKQVVAPALIVVAPVARLVDQLLGGRGDLTVFDQPHFHLVNTARQWTGVEGLQPGWH
ncbi:hypothetical protein D3C73_477620 [compost metagenome]